MSSISPQKIMLITSLQKLVRYVQQSKQNQMQIFESLSKKDINKIISHFSDENSRIRKLSLTLLGTLLNSNGLLKLKICQRMLIQLIPGKICLNFGIDTKCELSGDKLMQLFQLLKKSVKKQDQQFTIWMINLRKYPFAIDYIPISAINYIDPLGHLVGFILPQNQNRCPKSNHFSIFQTVTKCFEGIRRKPEFNVAPSTQRISSKSTQLSNKFNRTRHSLRGSLAKTKDQNEENELPSYRPVYINFSQRIKSQAGSPRKQTFQCKKPSGNSINRLKNIHKASQSQSFSVIQTCNLRPESQIIYRPVFHSTNIYISTPVSSFSTEGQQIRQNRTSFDLNSSQNKVQFGTWKENRDRNKDTKLTLPFSSKQQRQAVNININLTNRYERFTQKQDYKLNGNKNFSLGQYREFISRQGNRNKVQEPIRN